MDVVTGERLAVHCHLQVGAEGAGTWSFFLFKKSAFPSVLGKMSHLGVDTSEMSHVELAAA